MFVAPGDSTDEALVRPDSCGWAVGREDGGFALIRFSDTQGEHAVTEAEAIERQRAAGLARGYVYESDEAALADFMAVNWAKSSNESSSIKDTLETQNDRLHKVHRRIQRNP